MAASREPVAERTAEVLRRRIAEGDLLPGTQLCEERLATPLGVSRNTLREAFRLLAHDGLLVHRPNYGVFVSEPDQADLADLYSLRRLVECGVVRSLGGLNAGRLDPLRRAAQAADFAASQHDWLGVGTANMRFHQELVALGGSARADDLIRRLLAELRLAFHVVPDPQVLHEPYLSRNRAILVMLEAGHVDRTAHELERYLRDSEEQLLEAYRAHWHIKAPVLDGNQKITIGVH